MTPKRLSFFFPTFPSPRSFCSVSHQFWYHRSRDESCVVDASAASPVGGAPFQDPLSTLPSDVNYTSTSSTASAPSAQIAGSSSCWDCCHPKERIRRLPRHLLFAVLSYFLCVLAVVIFGLSTERQMIIDPHSCLSIKDNYNDLNDDRYNDNHNSINNGPTMGSNCMKSPHAQQLIDVLVHMSF